MPLILLIIGIVIIVYNYRAIKREGVTKQEDSSFDISFQSVLQGSKEEFNDYKMELGLLRRDIAESLTELQEEIFDIKNDIHRLKKENYHRLKKENSYILKNNNSNRLKNNNKMYENKEDLENKYNIDENDIEININQSDDILEDEEQKEEINDSNIEHEMNSNVIMESEINDGVISEINFAEKVDSNKTTSIKKLLSEGLTDEQICHKLSVSKGEVLLVKGLFKK